MEKIAVKINVTRLLKEHFFAGKNGKYCDLILIPKDKPDQFGNHYSVAQSVSKEARQRGEKGPFVGDAKILGTVAKPKQDQPRDKDWLGEDGDDIPF